ncbi:MULTISPECIES: undecaprenyl-diphosphate phosphatase [unclassified Hyphomicrobium]|uniref:undecaprenyl-diphosphate phosphatase n=1 Tax=unclassified Hyphomicrobium TaxID=2619925 RepID=UPI000213F908|nr:MULTISPECIES: undecaprenyl-diphosphate phosphatase [unclassified Hyphomicrobium]CCB63610.1 Undecaprenyl-diphosphatase (Undecaprenyl pyrophosphate phosphatase) (Bacitracin resistance protein) [Hyphomicrobium sp. MC1]
METWQVILLGLIEGLTEYLPVSSTAHLLLTERLLGVTSTGRTFEVLIQLGAILALLTVYSAKLWRLAVDFPSDPRTRRFVFAILLAFLPAVFIGVAAHNIIKDVLFESPLIICVSLVIGGIILLVVDRMRYQPQYVDVMDIPPLKALIIGFVQCLAMIPGVSRSGSTIVGGMLLGADKRTAAEFSFFLAMPTMTGAFAYDLYKNWSILTPDDVSHIVLGFIAAFITGAIVVRYMLDFISRRGLSFFGWWRILVGGLGLGALMVLH